ncbi:MAG: YihY/virulence factor BrkB family protein [Chitinophagaceae bacterium]|jgi:membrane protein
MIKLQRIIIETKPVKMIIHWSKQLKLPGFEGIPLYDVVIFFFKQTQQIGLNERAASIAFNFLMAVPPLLIFLFTFLSYIPGSKTLYAEILILLFNIIPDDHTYAMIKNVLDDFFSAGTGTLSFGLLLAIYFSSNATLTIMRTFRKSMLHIEVENRNFIQIRWSAIRLTVLIIFLVIATILIMLTQTIFFTWLIEQVDIKKGPAAALFDLAQMSITFLLIYFSIGLIYRYAPHVQKKWSIASPGTLLATVLIIAFTYLFSYWVNNIASYNKIYGSLGSILILMFLVFFNSLVLLIGFELNVSINSLKAISQKRKHTT